MHGRSELDISCTPHPDAAFESGTGLETGKCMLELRSEPCCLTISMPLVSPICFTSTAWDRTAAAWHPG